MVFRVQTFVPRYGSPRSMVLLKEGSMAKRSSSGRAASASMNLYSLLAKGAGIKRDPPSLEKSGLKRVIGMQIFST